MFLEDVGLTESGVSRLIKAAYALLKNIGIYRALGSSKLLILLSFIAEGVIVATFTIGLGFTGVYVCILFMAQSISYLEPFVFNFGYFILILASIYALTVTAISLPVVMLLRKTPVEIIAKYDI